jgi:CheY-like chemotaxis protein
MQRTILLADDSPTIRRLVNQTFADANFRIVEVNNGDAAIKNFDEIRPDVVLADIYMPGKNGYQVCAYVRSHRELSKTPVVLLVGAFEAFDEDAAKRAGATANITKPFEPSALIDLVVSVLPQESQAVEEPPVVARPVETPAPAESDDLLGLASIFPAEPPMSATTAMTEDDINRVVDRVIQKLSKEVIENIAWDVVPDIAEKVVREELKRVK